MSNISLETFNANFLTHIRGFESGHTDETGVYDYGVGFNVVCKNNNRVMYFEAHVGSNVLPSNYTESNVVDAAWSNVIPDVKNWATSVVSSSNILGAQFIPSIAINSNLDFATTSNFSYSTFSSNFNVNVHRMETYPANNPASWCVGFKVTKSNDVMTSMLVDSKVTVSTFAIYKAEQEILDLGWSNVKENIAQWAQPIYIQSQFLNQQYLPSTW